MLPGIVRMFFNTLLNFGDTFCAGLLGTDALARLRIGSKKKASDLATASL